MSGTDPQLQDTTVGLPPESDEHIEGTTVELTDDIEGEAAPAQKSEAPPEGEEKPGAEDPPKGLKPKKRADNRVAVATQRAIQAETTAERLTRENEELKRRMAAETQQRQQVDQAALVQYGRAVSAEYEAAKRDFAEAQASGDPERIAEATGKLAAKASEREQWDNWKAANPHAFADKAAAQAQPQQKPAPQQQPQQKPAQQQAQAGADLDPVVAGWIQANSWFNPEHADFDQEMHGEAVAEGRRLERRYRREGKEDQIGSPEYFGAIEDYMRREFPDAFEGDAPAAPAKKAAPTKAAPVMSRGPGTVATVARSAPNGGSGSPTRIELSGEERKLAWNLAETGAMTQNGKKITDRRIAEQVFARQKLTQRSA
jgi:hypothetical protein